MDNRKREWGRLTSFNKLLTLKFVNRPYIYYIAIYNSFIVYYVTTRVIEKYTEIKAVIPNGAEE